MNHNDVDSHTHHLKAKTPNVLVDVSISIKQLLQLVLAEVLSTSPEKQLQDRLLVDLHRFITAG